MKILQVNQYYYPRGGAEKYFLDLSAALEKAGHEVVIFSMDHPDNLPSPWSSYFVSRISFNQQSLADKFKTPGRVLYSLEAKRKFTKLLEDTKPDIIHLHNIYHHISPSILTAAHKKNIPVVMHLHDYKLICPNHALFTKGSYCERCKPNKYYQCLGNRCVKDSLPGSALAMVEMYFHHSILNIYERYVDKFIAPSVFMKDKVVQFGQNPEKIKVVPNPYNSDLLAIDSDNGAKVEPDNYLLYFGRISPEKGLDTLIRSASLLKEKIVIAGEGPEEARLRKLAAELKTPVDFIGFKKTTELKDLILRAKAVVIPSIWGENMPLSLLESLSLGKIVIAARSGGIPEIITDGQNGLLFKPADSEDLARQIKRLALIDLEKMSTAAKNTSSQFSPGNNLAGVLDIYHELLLNKKKSG